MHHQIKEKFNHIYKIEKSLSRIFLLTSFLLKIITCQYLSKSWKKLGITLSQEVNNNISATNATGAKNQNNEYQNTGGPLEVWM